MKGSQIKYCAEELAWIEARKTMVRREAHALFVQKFGRNDVSLNNYNALCKRKGWMTGRTGCYEPGRTPENKGKKMPFNANSARTQFKKGQINGRAKELYKPIGTERATKDGYLERKIHDGMPLQSRWRAVHLIRWEEVNGPIPDGFALKCLDGDRTNTDPSNWEAVPRALLPRLSGRWCLGYDDAPDDLKPTLMATAKLKHAINEASGK
ncbi:HNH endonuclease signature motif containing protein [uncultured Ruegeria sp.]|uniref:HNH endonuclease signature motif containing protein n=1 Tax=uncultured Ruegeria sp. TaxID=259304 RepID=UPI0026218EA6|nr:HNH endonuclease signature motif containing protein [uncultured Ruegeria sp.]